LASAYEKERTTELQVISVLQAGIKKEQGNPVPFLFSGWFEKAILSDARLFPGQHSRVMRPQMNGQA
jgi:hypothetical protein